MGERRGFDLMSVSAEGTSAKDWQLRRPVLAAVAEERARQNRLKVEGRFSYTLADDGLTEAEKVACLMEEVGEVGTEVLRRAGKVTDGDGSDEALRKELIQVAALAVAWAESIGPRDKRLPHA